MSRPYSKKQKLLLIQKLLYENSDAKHPLTVSDIINYLAKFGISSERKTIYDDIQLLNDFGMDIIVTKQSHSNAYYLGTRPLQKEELCLIADVLATSKHISDSKYSLIIKKLQKLTSKYEKDILKRYIHTNNRVKIFNETLFENILIINNAINTDKILALRYFYYNTHKKKCYYNSNKYFFVSPYYIMYENDNYYLFCYHNNDEKLVKLRVDRMAFLKIENKQRYIYNDASVNLFNDDNPYLPDTKNKRSVTIEMNTSLINDVIDHLGSGIKMKKTSASTFIFTVNVELNPQFFSWLFAFGNNAKIVADDDAVLLTKQYLQEICKLY